LEGSGHGLNEEINKATMMSPACSICTEQDGLDMFAPRTVLLAYFKLNLSFSQKDNSLLGYATEAS
jgi:hypothetical protein